MLFRWPAAAAATPVGGHRWERASMGDLVLGVQTVACSSLGTPPPKAGLKVLITRGDLDKSDLQCPGHVQGMPQYQGPVAYTQQILNTRRQRSAFLITDWWVHFLRRRHRKVTFRNSVTLCSTSLPALSITGRFLGEPPEDRQGKKENHVQSGGPCGIAGDSIRLGEGRRRKPC